MTDVKKFPKRRKPADLPVPCPQCAAAMTVQAKSCLPRK